MSQKPHKLYSLHVPLLPLDGWHQNETLPNASLNLNQNPFSHPTNHSNNPYAGAGVPPALPGVSTPFPPSTTLFLFFFFLATTAGFRPKLPSAK